MSDVERIYRELISLREIIADAGAGPSDVSAFESIATKTLLLSAASYFERHIVSVVLDVAKISGAPEPLMHFINKQALERKYHSMFNWEASNINKFLSLFGDASKKEIEAGIGREKLEVAVADFIFINAQRNLLAHNNYAAAAVGATLDEVWDKYKNAVQVVTYVSSLLAQLCAPRDLS